MPSSLASAIKPLKLTFESEWTHTRMYDLNMGQHEYPN